VAGESTRGARVLRLFMAAENCDSFASPVALYHLFPSVGALLALKLSRKLSVELLRARQLPAKARKQGLGGMAPWESLKGDQSSQHRGPVMSHFLSCSRLVTSWNDNARKELPGRPLVAHFF
jgi:hypothetical protein